MHFHVQQIIQIINHALFHSHYHFSFYPLSNLTYAFGAQDNESSAQSRWAAGRCKHSFIKICTRLVYTTDTVPLGYESICHNSKFFRLLLVHQSILNSNLTVNILLWAFKSFIGKYNILCIFIQTNHFNTHAIFMSFISQSINFSNLLT